MMFKVRLKLTNQISLRENETVILKENQRKDSFLRVLK